MGGPYENDPAVPVKLQLPRGLVEDAREEARRQRVTLADYFCELAARDLIQGRRSR